MLVVSEDQLGTHDGVHGVLGLQRVLLADLGEVGWSPGGRDSRRGPWRRPTTSWPRCP